MSCKRGIMSLHRMAVHEVNASFACYHMVTAKI